MTTCGDRVARSTSLQVYSGHCDPYWNQSWFHYTQLVLFLINIEVFKRNVLLGPYSCK